MAVEERKYCGLLGQTTSNNNNKPRSVQRRESQARYKQFQDSLPVLNVRNVVDDEMSSSLMEDMWEDPLLESQVPLMLSSSRLRLNPLHHHMMYDLGRESCVDSPRNSLIRLGLNNIYLPQLHDDQDQWQSNLFSAASSPSLIQSSSRYS